MSKLHPKVEQFKVFVKKHPKLIKHVRKNNESWQTYYEKWKLYGEEDDFWLQFKEEHTNDKKKSERTKQSNQELLNKLSELVNNIDINRLQEQIHQVNGVITNVQSVLQQFQQNKQQPFSRPQGRPNRFKFGKD